MLLLGPASCEALESEPCSAAKKNRTADMVVKLTTAGRSFDIENVGLSLSGQIPRSCLNGSRNTNIKNRPLSLQSEFQLQLTNPPIRGWHATGVVHGGRGQPRRRGKLSAKAVPRRHLLSQHGGECVPIPPMSAESFCRALERV